MKQCPQCHRTFQDAALRFCLFDGTELVALSAPPSPQQTGGYVQPQPPLQYGQPPPYVQPPYGQPPPSYVQPPYGQAPPRPSRAGGIVAAVLIGLLVVGGIGWNILQRLHLPGIGGGAASVSQDELENAVKEADQAEADAQAKLDDAPLSSKYTGTQLEKEKSTLQSLRAQGEVVEAHLTNQQFGKIYVSKDGTQAAVQVTETWDEVFRSAQTQQPVKTVTGSVSPQTILMRRGPSGWLVTDIQPGLQSPSGGQ